MLRSTVPDVAFIERLNESARPGSVRLTAKISATPKTMASDVSAVRNLRPRRYWKAIRALCQPIEINFVIIILPSFSSADASIHRDPIQLFTYLIGITLAFQLVLVHDLAVAQKDDSIS